ncbi:MAG: pilus (MSHA type) biogenesis protein MshL [Candidatus Pelagadaptatus aseana]|uniref:pilus (MSHA type) biogenesis protein MshL n=1 Tax=Candidatus Pelagadaptatus aseana TaxID=3120508 RepID=UPI0039B2D59C
MKPSMKHLLLGASALLLSACQTSSVNTAVGPVERQSETIEQAANQYSKDSKPAVSSEKSVVDQLLLAGGAAESKTKAEVEDETFDVSVIDINSRDFFLGLVAGTDLNVVVHPEVTGTVSLGLKNVTIEEVLATVRDIYGYEYKLNGSIYTIYPRKLRTEIFKIDYLDVKRVGVSDTSILIGKIDSESGDSSSSSSDSGDETSNLFGLAGLTSSEGGAGSEAISPGSRVQTLTRTDFWTSLQETMMAMIGTDGVSGERMVVVNPQAGLVVVKAYPQELNAIRRFLDKSELSVKRQVILETKILEVQLNDSFNAGINWNAINGQLLLTNNVVDFTAQPSIDTASEAVGEVFSSIFMVNDITTLIDLLQTQGNVQVLSSPRVSTVNNQKAMIRVGSDEFFLTGLSSDTVSNASSTVSTPDVELSSFFSGIALDVTPQIADNGEVILHIHPVVSTISDQVKEFTIGNSEYSLPLALREIRESDSIVRASSGQIVVLGGLMQERQIDVNSKHPYIGDVPVVDTFFKRKNNTTVKTELVILMRPIIVEDNEDWANDIRQSNSRIKDLGSAYRNR